MEDTVKSSKGTYAVCDCHFCGAYVLCECDKELLNNGCPTCGSHEFAMYSHYKTVNKLLIKENE